MKKLILSLSAIAVLAISATAPQAVQAQAKPSIAHKVGLIDMAHVFQNYKKFEVLREDLKAEIAQSDQEAKKMADQMKSLQEQMKELKPDSQNYIDAEKRLLKMKSEFDAFTQGARRDLMRRESEIYKTIYLEVADAVQKYAQYYKYTLVIRFNREGLDDKATPPEVVQRMNKQVVYYQPEDDITDSVLQYLNRVYDESGSGGAARSARGTTGGTQR